MFVNVVNWYRQSLVVLLTVITLLGHTALAADNQDFPGRALYPGLTWITLEDFYKIRGSSYIVDARSAYEYNTLHIRNAVNIPLSSKDFTKVITAMREEDPKKPMVFYCNGHSCLISYKAAMLATKAHIAKVYVFDAGIHEWSQAYPKETVMLGKTPVDKKALITPQKLAEHMLEPEAFGQWVQREDTLLIDIRDKAQVEGIKFWPFKQESIPLDNQQLEKVVARAKAGKKTLLVYDAVGKQVPWLQYYLEAQGLSSYYFLKGGAKAYYETMQDANTQ